MGSLLSARAKKAFLRRLASLESRSATKAFGAGAKHFDNQEALIKSLRKAMHGEMTVLVKGSRSMKMERVVAGIVEADSNAETGGGKA